MVPPDSVALRLRFREHDASHGAPDVAAFCRAPASTPAVPVPALQEEPREVGVLAGGRPLEPSAPVVVFFQHAAYGIPAIRALGVVQGLPELSSWSVRPALFGYLACVPPPARRGEPRRSRAGAWVVAACLPLVAPALAEAAPDKPPPVQVPELDGSVPAPPGSEPEAAALEAEPVAEPAAVREPSEDSVVDRPRPAGHDESSVFDPSTVDAAWEGVDGFDVELELKGGETMSGRVGAVQRETFTLIQAKTGAVLVLPKSGVVSLRVRVPPPLPGKTGTGAIVAGSILTSHGAPVFIAGVVMLGVCPSCAYLHVPLLLVGGAALGGGIPLLVRGVRARRAYSEAERERALSPVVVRTPHGWTGGLRFRF